MEPILTRCGYRCDLCLACKPSTRFIAPYENKARLDGLRSSDDGNAGKPGEGG